jgi:hypothetical protein
MNERELKGIVQNSKVLGERKNCNLPGAAARGVGGALVPASSAA